jgi:hypothetical protein
VVAKLKETVAANAAMGEHYAAQARRFPAASAPEKTALEPAG